MKFLSRKVQTEKGEREKKKFNETRHHCTEVAEADVGDKN